MLLNNFKSIYKLKQSFPGLNTFTKINAKSFMKFSLGSFCMTYFVASNKKKKAYNCGIIAYLGKQEKAVDVCVEGIQILQFRGYDSTGICTIEDSKFNITKFASDFSLDNADCIKKITEIAPKNHKPSHVGIGHTRWATHGAKTSINAHPHCDSSGKISLVHNGIIDNYKEIKEFLYTKGITMKSETDSEVVAQLIGHLYSTGLSFKEAVTTALKKHITGSYALAIINTDFPDSMIVTRCGSPLLIGTGADFFIVSSDVAAFQRHTNNYINIDNLDVVELNLTMNLSHYKIEKSVLEDIYLQPKKEFEHFMLQEIFEQPDSINRAMNYGSRLQNISNKITSVKLGGLEQYKDFIKPSKNLVVVACGTSYFASQFVMNLIRKLSVFNTAQLVNGCEFTEDFIPKENPVMVFVSQSGETYDVLKPLEIARSKGVLCIGIINKVESTMARTVLCGIFINGGREISVASTKAFSGQVIALILCALFFSQIKQETSFLNPVYETAINFIKRIPQVLPDLLLDMQKVAKNAAEKLFKTEHIFLLGKGYGEAIANEISLKIKEVSYVHSESYNASSFKHGPMAMIDPNQETPVLIIAVKDSYFDDMNASFEQLKLRKATIILLTNNADKMNVEGVPFLINLPSEGELSSYYAVFFGQMFAYYISIAKGLNPDKPRNLSKELTTK